MAKQPEWNDQLAFSFGPRKVLYTPTPTHGIIDASLARQAVENAFNCFAVNEERNPDLFKEVEECLMIAMSCSNLSWWDFYYLMVTWGCEPWVADDWLTNRKDETLCARARTWLLTVAFPFDPTDAKHRTVWKGRIQLEKDDHDEWQKNRTKLMIEQRQRTSRALPPPTDPHKIMSWRKMALWRAQKLGLAGVRHERGILLGSVKAAAAQITVSEFGLDTERGGHNTTLLKQLLSISPEHGQWQEFMEMSARVEMITDGVLDKQPSNIPWFPRRLLEVELVRHRERGESLHEITIRDKYDYMYFTRPGEYANVKLNMIHLSGRPLGCFPHPPYEHRSHDD